ncbi:MAG: tRNA preQ1(34) S-adenosylmethionine ribosyltransferase-isomerase QueA [bacterium]|nr:tRNA preQ1(34) S-adenosylmethionine ribosyltransferase-isomerase QueA [bacterium]
MSNLQLTDFHYELPNSLIAQTPTVPRDHSRLLVLDRKTESISHHHFFDLPRLLRKGDVIVRNNTKVIPARVFGKKSTGGQVEVLLVRRIEQPKEANVGFDTWECLTKPGLKPGQVVEFDHQLQATCESITGYSRLLSFNQPHHQLLGTLASIGELPLPPYIHWNPEDQPELREKYQTTYAKVAGSAAAPTAGLHFTPGIDRELNNKGVQIIEVTLHVGLGTFMPVKEQNIAHHQMHHEWYSISTTTAEKLNQAKQNHQRIIAVGTTTSRVLESSTNNQGQVVAGVGTTNIFIYPPYKIKFVDALVTNFHQPQSTLLMLISAFVSQPNTSVEFSTFGDSLVGRAYQAAIQNKYRFFSFGDAMLIE